VRTATFNPRAETFQQPDHCCNITDLRNVVQYDFVVGQQRCSQQWQRCVLVAGWFNASTETVTAFDDETFHVHWLLWQSF
jgi:hypothetical protein